MTRNKKWFFSIIALAVVGFLVYSVVVGIHLTYIPLASSVQLRDGKVGASCLFSSDCEMAYKDTDYTQCTEASICGGGDMAVNYEAFIKLAESRNYLLMKNNELEKTCPNGIGSYGSPNSIISGCPAGFYQRLKPICFFFHCGIYDVDK